MSQVSPHPPLAAVSPQKRGGFGPSGKIPSGKMRALAGVLLAAATVWITSDAWGNLTNAALHDEQASHVLAVPIAIALLVLARRKRLANYAFRNHWVGPAMMLFGLGLWVYGYTNEKVITWMLGAVLAAVGGLVTGLGTEALRRFAPAFVAVFFIIPPPASSRAYLSQPLQERSATVTQDIAEVLNMNSTQAGRTLRINGQDVTVAEACSGMRMLATLFLACFMSAYTQPLREPVRLLILLLSPLVAIVANVIRLVITLWAYGEFDPATADQLHSMAGWVMVIAAFLMLDSVVRLLVWMQIPVMKPAARTRPSAAPVAVMPAGAT